jgi:tetratricopeptide (TPR) repeat protein
LIWCLAELGEFREAIARNQESFQIAAAASHAPTRGGAYMGASLLHVRSGDLASAVSIGEQGLELCRAWGLRAVLPYVAAQLGYAHALAGRVAAGLPLLREALEVAEAVGHLRSYSLWVGWLAEALALAGQEAEAGYQAARALGLARERKERGVEAWALRLQAEVAVRSERPDPELAERAYRQALALAEQLGMRPLQAHCRAGLGDLYLRLGRAEAGRAELSAAAAAYRALELAFWLTRAEERLAQAR